MLYKNYKPMHITTITSITTSFSSFLVHFACNTLDYSKNIFALIKAGNTFKNQIPLPKAYCYTPYDRIKRLKLDVNAHAKLTEYILYKIQCNSSYCPSEKLVVTFSQLAQKIEFNLNHLELYVLEDTYFHKKALTPVDVQRMINKRNELMQHVNNANGNP